MRPLLFVSLRRMGEQPRLFARFHTQRNGYHSYRKSEMGRYSTQKTAYFIHRSICGAGKITVNFA